MHSQGKALEEILSNVHLNFPDTNVLRELLYTAVQCGLIEGVCEEDVETITKIFSIASMYDRVPEELRM